MLPILIVNIGWNQCKHSLFSIFPLLILEITICSQLFVVELGWVPLYYIHMIAWFVIYLQLTGRVEETRRWSDGIHQAVEAKEGLKIQVCIFFFFLFGNWFIEFIFYNYTEYKSCFSSS